VDQTTPVSHFRVIIDIEESSLVSDLAFEARAGSDSVAKARANRLETESGARIESFLAMVELVHASTFAQQPQ
jgi:hypothetical protein